MGSKSSQRKEMILKINPKVFRITIFANLTFFLSQTQMNRVLTHYAVLKINQIL